ncbi:MAG: TIGR04084 family radical SAM/SPASM domain-containing protein [Nitrososphaerota archaeon]
MLFIIYTTGKCNLNCSYCGGSFNSKIVPWNVNYKLEDLLSLFKKEDKVAFYGGEPLLNYSFMKEVMDKATVSKWIIQTNGLLLDRIEEKYLSKIDALLISIDGGEELTNKNRGPGVYERVIKNVKKVRKVFKGDIIARMTVTEDSDIYRDVKHLLSTNLFDHIHWQLSFVWTEKERWKDLWGWIEEKYKPGLKRLIKEWISNLEKGFIDGIAPFQGILKGIMKGSNFPPCGSGIDSFAILTDGKVISCPIAVYENWARVGYIWEISREDLENRKPIVNEPCISCSYLRICGTRCLYTHIERIWGEEGMKAICACSKYIIDLVKENLEKIKEASSKAGFTIEDLIYPKYNNTIEIIP